MTKQRRRTRLRAQLLVFNHQLGGEVLPTGGGLAMTMTCDVAAAVVT